jgi:hypothetical protein
VSCRPSMCAVRRLSFVRVVMGSLFSPFPP